MKSGLREVFAALGMALSLELERRVAEADLAQLRVWRRKAMTASTADEALAQG